MLPFRTTLTAPKFPFNIRHGQKILGIGSCFVENIGDKLASHKFGIELNPFGILYHPLALSCMMERLLKNQPIQVSELFEYEGLWHSFLHHGSFSHPDKDRTLARINERFVKGRECLLSADYLLITFGTSTGFLDKKSGTLVGNCHKVPGTEFEKSSTSVGEMVDHWEAVFRQLFHLNPKLKVILTVSPVRYLKEGFVKNQRSKARLLLSCEELERQFDRVFYFPAYEIIMDDLRDYRFFGQDLVHPNQTGIDYIWEIFCDSFFTQETKKLNAEIEKIVLASQHRPFHPGQPAHQHFLKNQLQFIEKMKAENPNLDFESERRHFLSALEGEI